MTQLQTYRVTPRAPLVFRSGKPFLSGTRDKAQYPWPSSWAGLLRTRFMDQHGIAPDQVDSLLELPTAGALLARRKAGQTTLFVPRPADALALLGSESFLRLAPLVPTAGTGSDLPSGLLPVGLEGTGKGKPQPAAPFWPMEDFIRWASGQPVATKHRYVLPQEENRTHVGIDPKTGRAIDGRLFRTMGLDFGPVTRSGDDGQWAFVGQGPVGLEPGLVVFGGERRLSGLENEAAGIWALPDALRTPLLHASGFALTLATPALFEGGWRPGWLDVDGTGMVPGSALRVRLRAALVDRWQPVSGWDLRNQKPKAMRRAIAAGSTYWFEIIEGQLDPAALWLSAVSDQVQDRLDGFGLSLLRPWAVLS